MVLSSGNDSFYIYEGFLGGTSDATLTDVTDQTIDGGGGFDTVFLGDSYPNNNFTMTVSDVGVVTLTAASGYTIFQNFESFKYTNNLILAVGSAGNDSVSGGNGNDPGLYGLAGNDTLNGGTGADIMLGGAGNDTYIVDNVGDSVQETTTLNGMTDAGGVDLVKSSVSVTLGNFVENLALGGTSAISGTGNALANVLTGNTAGNLLNGGGGNDKLIGGTGADTMLGGAGNDTYYVDNAGDSAQETTTVGGATNAGGIDTVISTASYLLGNFVENLTLAGTGAINGTGNTLANKITGNAAANNLNGAAGNDMVNGSAGNDHLTGGAGVDSFVFNTPLNAASNLDTITDYDSGGNLDRIFLSDTIFKALGTVTATTALDATMFFAGAAAHDANDHIIYNQSTGALYYDSDGTGAAAQVQFAAVGTTTHPVLNAGDFFVIP